MGTSTRTSGTSSWPTASTKVSSLEPLEPVETSPAMVPADAPSHSLRLLFPLPRLLLISPSSYSSYFASISSSFTSSPSPSFPLCMSSSSSNTSSFFSSSPLSASYPSISLFPLPPLYPLPLLHLVLLLPGFVQCLQCYYQSGCLYRLRALGERHNLDLTVGERRRPHWQEVVTAPEFQLFFCVVFFFL